jgi:hypothetical protein
MATYYVRTDGNNANAGTGSAANQAWQTLAKALGASGISSGDIVYVAPGRYNESVTVAMTSATTTTRIVGDPTASQFSGVSTGEVLWTGLNTAGTKTITTLLLMTSKNYLSFENIHFEAPSTFGVTSSINCTTCTNTSFVRCQMTEPTNGTGHILEITSPSSTALNFTLDSCHIFYNRNSSSRGFTITGQNVSDNSVIKNCIVMCHTGNSIGITNLQCKVYNNTFIGSGTGFENQGGSSSFQSTVQNNLFIGCIYGIFSNTSNTVLENYNRYIGVANISSNAVSGGNSSTLGGFGIFGSYALQQGLVFGQILGTNQSSPNTSFGNATGAPTTDMYGVAWSGTSPDAGSATLRSIGAVGNYIPTERNASTITIAPASTSQSIELYLGATGLTASTSGLSARYNRTRTASVSIPLVARTIAQAWTAGGFAEVDAVEMPGVYRLDLPNDALLAGADDVTVVVRGASGTNGAVMTIKLSSGGLTGAQTASAVWGASVAGYVAETDFGGVVNATRNVVGGIETNVQDIPQTVWDEPKANHTIPNTFGDYLDTKVSTGADTSRIQLRQGPFLIKQNATEGLITEVNQFLSTVPNMEIVLIDSSGGAVSVAGSTLVLRVRNQAGTAVVNNVTPTVAYADGGVIRWTPNLSWNALSVTTPGTYRIIVERTMGTTTTTFGPFLVQLSSG